MPDLSLNDYTKLIVRSRLASEAVVASVCDEFRRGANPPNPSAADLAKFFEAKKLLTEWQNQKLLQGRYKGFILGKYRFLRKIGSGGMGAVYLGEHTVMNRLAAIKVLPKIRVDKKSYLERFILEARALAQLDHKNIVKVYDVDNLGDLHYIVMEYVPGLDLEQLVKAKGPLTDVKAANYIGQAVHGLHHAHHRKLIHRDIKPGNLLLDKSKTIKLLDLGLARLDDDNHSLTTAHDEKMLGTADYLAPEQALNCHAADARADIYSLGCTLYFLLTGHPPFYQGSVAKRLLAHQSKSPVAIDVERKRLNLSPADAGLIHICNRMMAKKPEDRFQTAKDVYTAILQWLDPSRRNKQAGESALASMNALDQPSHESADATPSADVAADITTVDVAAATTVAPAVEYPMSTVDTNASQMDFATMVDPGSSAIPSGDWSPSDVWSPSSIYSGSMLQQAIPLDQHEPDQSTPAPTPPQSPALAKAGFLGDHSWVWIAMTAGGLLFVIGLVVMILARLN